MWAVSQFALSVLWASVLFLQLLNEKIVVSLDFTRVQRFECKDGEVPVFGTNGKIGTSHMEALCKFPSFIVGRKGAYRGVHYSSVPFSVIDTGFYAKPLNDSFDLKWAYYKFLTYDINSMNSGSAIPSTDRYELYKIAIELPSLEVQKKTVAILDSLSEKIECNNRINRNLLEPGTGIISGTFY